MGAGGSKGDNRHASAGSRGNARRVENVDVDNLSASNPDYPPPYVPETYKEEIFTPSVVTAIRARINEMPKTADGSYTSLLNKLSTFADTEVQFVTAVYLWMKSQDYESSGLDMVKHGDTPKGYMKKIKEGRGDLTSFFTILCRRAGIPCIIKEGIGKGEDYTVGDSEKRLATRWTIVYADDEWHFAHIDWCMQVNKDDNRNQSNKEPSDYFFLTNPDDFIQFCLPDEYPWQLLDRPVSKKEFLTVPNCRPEFYELGGTVVSPKTSIVKAMHGKVDVEITFPKPRMSEINLSYLLTYIDVPNESEETANLLNNLEKFVLLNRKSNKFLIEICLPVAGKYLIDIFGEIERKNDKGHDEDTIDTETEITRFCQFKFISDKTFETEELELLPDSPPNGWGPGPQCKLFGLVPKSNLEGVIYMKPGEVRNIVFKMQRDLDVTCQLIHNYLPVYVLVEQVECTTDRREVNIRLKIPEDGQYALKIYSREPGSQGYSTVCVYLIRQRTASRLPEKYRDKMIRSRLEYHIDNHTSEKALQDAIKVHKCYNVPDNGELGRAEEKLKMYWETKRGLRSAVIGRNVKMSHRWLGKANNSKYKSDLEEEIRQAERMGKNMERLNGNQHPIAKMDPQTIIEIRNYKRPPRIVHDVMASTFTLLGEDKADLQNWEQIQYFMGKTGHESLQKRVVARRVEDVSLEMAKEAETDIEPYNLQKCRAVSNGICSFYKWDKQMIRDAKRLAEEENERYERDHPLSEYDDLESNREENSRPQSRQPSRHSGSQSRGSDHGSEKTTTKEEDIKESNHPFAVNDNENINSKPRFASRPSELKEDKPVSYAGWKPPAF